MAVVGMAGRCGDDGAVAGEKLHSQLHFQLPHVRGNAGLAQPLAAGSRRERAFLIHSDKQADVRQLGRHRSIVVSCLQAGRASIMYPAMAQQYLSFPMP